MVVLGQLVGRRRPVDELRVGHGGRARARDRCTRTTTTSTWSGSGSRSHERAAMSERRRGPRRGHAPVGQVGTQLRRVRRGRGTRRAGRRRRRRGATCSSCRAPTPCATATRATSPAPRSRRRSAGRAHGSRRATRRARRGATALDAARAQILAGLVRRRARRRRRHHARRASSRPNGGERGDDPDWLRFRLLGATNPTYFALYARRRMELYGATDEDFAHGQGEERAARARTTRTPRYRKEVTDRRGARVAGRRRSRCGCSRSARRPTAAPPSSSRAWTTPGGTAYAIPVRDRRGLDGDADAIRTRSSRCPTSRPTPRPASALPERAVPRLDRRTPRTRRPGIGPDDLDLAEVYDLSTALELDWYENIGLCKPGEAERLLQRRRHHHRRPHPGQPERRARVLRRGRSRPGDRPGVRAHLAAAGPGRRPPGRGRAGRAHRQPGPVRPRLVGDRERSLSAPRPTSSTQCARRSAGAAAACRAVHPADLGAHVIRALVRPQRPRPARGRRRVLRLRRRHRSSGRRHRPHRVAGRRDARGGSRHDRSTASADRRSRRCTSPRRR